MADSGDVYTTEVALAELGDAFMHAPPAALSDPAAMLSPNAPRLTTNSVDVSVASGGWSQAVDASMTSQDLSSILF